MEVGVAAARVGKDDLAVGTAAKRTLGAVVAHQDAAQLGKELPYSVLCTCSTVGITLISL